MKVSVGHALPGPARPDPMSPGGHAGRSATDDKGEAGFDHLLRQAQKSSHAQSHAQKQQAADAAPRQSRWPEFTAKLADSGGDEDVTLVAPATEDAVKPSEDEPETTGSETRNIDKHQPQAQIPSSVPLLIALHDLHRNRASVETDGTDAATASTTAQPDTGHEAPAKPQTGEAGTKLPELGQPGPEVKPLPAEKSVFAVPVDKTKAVGAEPQKVGSKPLETTPAPAGADHIAPDSDTALQKPAAKVGLKSTADAPVTSVTPSQADRQTAPPTHVVVTGEQNFPAPASHPASQTATSLASAIATDSGVKQALSASAGHTQSASPVALPSHILKIELHPAELGMVTASLRLAGGQLSIELKPENQEAHRRLSSDTDTLVKSLRGMGFDVDKVTVLQPSIAINPPVRTDATSLAANPAGRDPSSFQPGNSGGNGDTSGGQQSGRNRDNEGQHPGRNAPHPRERAGGDLFI